MSIYIIKYKAVNLKQSVQSAGHGKMQTVEQGKVCQEHSSRKTELRGCPRTKLISKTMFVPNGAYCVFILQIFMLKINLSMQNFENWGIFSDIPQFQLGNIRSYSEYSHASKNIWQIINFHLASSNCKRANSGVIQANQSEISTPGGSNSALVCMNITQVSLNNAWVSLFVLN